MCDYCLQRLYSGKPLYGPNATAYYIVEDGWSRGWKPCMVSTDLVLSGFKIDKRLVFLALAELSTITFGDDPVRDKRVLERVKEMINHPEH